MSRNYKCALRHSDDHCPIYFDCFDKSKCNSKCGGFIPSIHKCKENKEHYKIETFRGLGDYVQSMLSFYNLDTNDWHCVCDIIFCPFCGERVTFGVTALKVANDRFMQNENSKK